MPTHLRLCRRVLLALVILAAVGCSDVKPATVAVTTRDTSRARIAPAVEVRQEARDTSRAAVSLWSATVEAQARWFAVVTWNAAVAENERRSALAAATKSTKSQKPREDSATRVPTKRPTSGVDWDAIAACESGGDWHIYNPPYSGGLQFMSSTWSGYGGREFASMAYLASREQQITIAERVLAGQGIGAWPVCGRRG